MIKFRVQIHEARNLKSRDKNQLSDSFCEIRLGNQLSKSRVVAKTLNPSFDYEVNLVITAVMLDNSLALIIAVWDKDTIGKEFLGLISLPIAEIGLIEFEDFAPKWFPLSPRSYKDKVTGDIRISVGYVGGLDDSLKRIIDSFTKTSLHARIITTDDPTDEVFFNNTIATSNDSIPSQSSLGESTEVLEKLDPSKSLNHAQLMGLLTVEISSAAHLPYQHNKLRTSFNCDPFVVISFGKKTFKTRLIRHSLNPIWNESCFLHIKNHEYKSDYKVLLSVYDYETVSCNDNVGVSEISIKELIGVTKLPEHEKNKATFFTLADLELKLRPKSGALLNPEPTLKLRVGFVPYADIRRNLWLTLAKTYDSDNNGVISSVELLTLLDSIGSTLSNESVNLILAYGQFDAILQENTISFETLSEVLEDMLNDSKSTAPDEHIISITMCPICKKKIKEENDLDVVSHVALCAHEDLNKLDRFVTGGLLTEQNASRKWYTKILSYVAYGEYNIGKHNTANILVQDRITGQLEEERMPTYIRLGIRIMYQGARVRHAAQSKAIKNLLKSMSDKQGRKFNDPSSRKDIRGFIAFHNIQTDDILDPLDSFANFNEFFYRKLKPEARPVASPDPRVAVSVADCRLNVFASIDDATNIWIKGQNFTMSNFLADPIKGAIFQDGSCAIFRLAPQDYHRFHAPVDGIIGSTKTIAGEYYTVNPMAIRTTIDVYTENVRKITYIESDHFGTVAFGAVGAMMVGAINLTTEKGQRVNRLDEHGYFAFGGSTCIVFFQKGMIEFDSDLIDNSLQGLETLMKVGMSIGRSTRNDS